MTVDVAGIYAFIRDHIYVVQASVSPSQMAQAAVVGIVVTENLEIFFDTLSTSRKYGNLRQDPRIAFVMWQGEQAVQYEGVVDEPTGGSLSRLKALYFARFPDGRDRERLPEIAYLRARPTWIRHSDFSTDPPIITELAGADLP
ncbi:MAG: hypothetical protein GEU73_00470 [Chloroflexi bacterium]|nr:hypothetical protein [Chloroflexota bacterium]